MILSKLKRPLINKNIIRYFSQFKYTKTHEYIKNNKNIFTVGITNFAAESLGDIVYLELPLEGQQLTKNDIITSIDSSKAVSDIISPISGTISKVNHNLDKNPSIINESPQDKGWIVEISSEDNFYDLDLMDESQYNEYIEEI